jgi:hypothetical protein
MDEEYYYFRRGVKEQIWFNCQNASANGRRFLGLSKSASPTDNVEKTMTKRTFTPVTEKKNCWELKNCGREPGGHAVHELGICPATTSDLYDGINGGANAGRICWAVSGTFCGGTMNGQTEGYADCCVGCEVFKQIATEQSFDLILRPKETPLPSGEL